jgi:hypothetical protein
VFCLVKKRITPKIKVPLYYDHIVYMHPDYYKSAIEIMNNLWFTDYLSSGEIALSNPDIFDVVRV